MPVVLALAVLASCGSRTELDPQDEESIGSDAGTASDTSRDARVPRDASIVDATPPVDASICPSGTTAFLLSTDATLYAFDPPTLATSQLGTVVCPTTDVPWTLTASSTGLLYVMYEDWEIYLVDPKTLTCTKTPYVPGQLGLGDSPGITILSNAGVEKLYIYGQDQSANNVLDVGDLTDFTLTNVGSVLPQPSEFPLDLRANAFGRIFGLGSGGAFVEIDRGTAALLSEDDTSFTNAGTSWALLTWNDTFYFFAGSTISQYDPVAKTVTTLGTVNARNVVGATAAPCLH